MICLDKQRLEDDETAIASPARPPNAQQPAPGRAKPVNSIAAQAQGSNYQSLGAGVAAVEWRVSRFAIQTNLAKGLAMRLAK
jgi:hypothetical protein